MTYILLLIDENRVKENIGSYLVMTNPTTELNPYI